MATARIVDLHTLDAGHRERAAELLHEGFRDHWPDAWPTLDDARLEVSDALDGGRIVRAALLDEALVGWVGAQPSHGRTAWELHPLVVDPAHQRHGIGRALVRALDDELARRGAVTLWLGTDDEAGLTSLAGRDLYDDVLGALAALEDRGGHPVTFYRRIGFHVVGVVPDANGPGKPDILMAKRVGA